MPSETRPHLRVQVVKGVAIVGFLDTYLQATDVIKETSDQLLELVRVNDYEKVLLNFEGVRFLSSEMIAVVLKFHRRMVQYKGHLRLCGLAPNLRDIFRVSQLDKLLNIFDTDKDALAKY